MGNGQGASRGSVEYASAYRTFSVSELKALLNVYASLSAQSRGEYAGPLAFQAYFQIRGSLGARLFDMVTQRRKANRLSFEDLIVAKATYETASRRKMEEFMFELLDLAGDGVVERTEVESAMFSILLTVLCSKDRAAETSLPEESLQAFLNAAEYSGYYITLPEESEAEPCMSIQDFRKLCALIPSVKRFLASLLKLPDICPVGRQIPSLVVPKAMSCSPLLRNEYAWHISGPLQQQEMQDWVLLYHSSVNGLSLDSFLGNVKDVEGPTILIIKDKEGCIYGGYASQPWEKHSDFYGDLKSFLFTLHPRISLYRPTGSNTNLQWCAYNFTSESIPNGVGFGGQIDHFGLFLSGSFDRGHTRYSVTFGNPALSTKEELVPHTIECWGVLAKGHGDEEGPDRSNLKGILERF